MGRQSRQRPISCTLCRVRKLRCSRVFPCSNCTSRGVACQHEAVTPAAPPPPPPRRSVAGAAEASTLDLLSRLERLEALFASQARDAAAPPPPPPPPPPHSPPLMTVPARLQRLTADALWLERSCSGQKILDSLVADPIIFRTCPIRLIAKPSSFVPDPSAAASSSADPPQAVKCILLPRRDETRVLVQKYNRDIGHLHHIVHSPSLPVLIESIYDGLDRGHGADPGALLLLLSICTSTMYSWTPQDDAKCLFASASEANSQTTAWLKAGLDMVDHVHRTAHASLECTQGMVILFFVLCSLEGVSSRARCLVAQSIAMGRELALHSIDYPGNSTAPAPAHMGTIKTEMGRRVWWYLAASDWMLSQYSVPQEGTYTIHPKQMAVRKPRNVHDEDIVDGRDVIDRPLHEPTCVSYLLQRIRLAEVCHALLDRSPFILLSPEAMDYGQVIEVDTRLKRFMKEMPPFFSLDNVDWSALPPTDPRRSPSITVQRYTLNILLHRQLCKLHLPYLARGTVEPAFAYSHVECLKSARLIIHVEHQLRQEDLPFVSLRQRMNMVLRSVFLACIALVLDACLGSESQDGSSNGEEVSDAWGILQEAKDQSPLASKLLELSIQVLAKHRATHPALKALGNQSFGRLGLDREPAPMTPESGHHEHGENRFTSLQGGLESETAYLEHQWEALQGRMDLDSIDWDRMFRGLDAPFI